jgi:exonuclease III
VEDIWRKRFPDIKQYTFMRNESKSRIDYFFTSKIIDSEVSSPKIQHFIHSDHDLVSLILKKRDRASRN